MQMAPKNFTISRALGVQGSSVDLMSKLVWNPPVDSDELFDALRTAYPSVKNHAERKRKAVFDFLMQEKEENARALQLLLSSSSPESPSTGSSSGYGSPSSDSHHTADSHSPVMATTLPTPAPTTTPPFTSSTPAISPAPSAPQVTSAKVAKHSPKDMIQVWTASGEAMPKIRTRRTMTDAEKKEYRKQRKIGACANCRQQRRKCRHNGQAGYVQPTSSKGKAKAKAGSNPGEQAQSNFTSTCSTSPLVVQAEANPQATSASASPLAGSSIHSFGSSSSGTLPLTVSPKDLDLSLDHDSSFMDQGAFFIPWDPSFSLDMPMENAGDEWLTGAADASGAFDLDIHFNAFDDHALVSNYSGAQFPAATQHFISSSQTSSTQPSLQSCDFRNQPLIQGGVDVDVPAQETLHAGSPYATFDSYTQHSFSGLDHQVKRPRSEVLTPVLGSSDMSQHTPSTGGQTPSASTSQSQTGNRDSPQVIAGILPVSSGTSDLQAARDTAGVCPGHEHATSPRSSTQGTPSHAGSTSVHLHRHVQSDTVIATEAGNAGRAADSNAARISTTGVIATGAAFHGMGSNSERGATSLGSLPSVLRTGSTSAALGQQPVRSKLASAMPAQTLRASSLPLSASTASTVPTSSLHATPRISSLPVTSSSATAALQTSRSAPTLSFSPSYIYSSAVLAAAVLLQSSIRAAVVLSLASRASVSNRGCAADATIDASFCARLKRIGIC